MTISADPQQIEPSVGMPTDIRQTKDTRQLMRVALGQETADLAVINARLVNVYSGEQIGGQSVAVKGEWIAAVGPEEDMAIGPQTRVIDAAGRTLIPGLIDGHAHLSWYACIDHYLPPIMVGGTTTIITESTEAFPMAGLEGVVDFLTACQDQPIKIFATAPFMASISRSTHGVDSESLQTLLARPDVVGLGESYWQSALQHVNSTIESMTHCLRAGKIVEGHSAGARGKKLQAYVVAGAASCHESISADDILERLRLGLHVMVREGSIRKDLDALLAIKDLPIDHRRLILVTDGVAPADLLANGYLESVVQKAIDRGIDPVQAIQMATLNVAEHFAMDDLVGGIAPGRCADMVIVPDIRTIEAQSVISKGCVIAEQGRLLKPARHHHFSRQSMHTIHLPRPKAGADFIIRAPQGKNRIMARVIDMVTDLVSREHHQEIKTIDGCITADPANDLIKVAAIDRRHGMDNTFVGLLKGYGLKAGAVACSAAWDSADIIALGADDDDLAVAVNRIHEIQGGMLVCLRKKIVAELPLPVFGILSPLPLTSVAKKVKAISEEINRLGCPFNDPLLTLQVLTGAAIPFLRICEEGLVNLKDGLTKGLFLDDNEF